MNSSPQCRVCGGARVAQVLQAKERMFGLDGEFECNVCGDCGSVSLAVSDFDLAKYYPPEYYSFSTAEAFGFKAKLASAIARALPKNMCSAAGRLSYSVQSVADVRRTVTEWLGRPVKSPRVLDVGCGSGSWLMPYHYAGCRTEGIDPFYEGEDPKEFPIHRVALAELTGTYDLITFHHSLEHTPNPKSYLESAYRLLADDGACVVRLPKLPSAAFETYQESWFALDAPRHYFIPTVAGFTQLAEDVGFASVVAADEASPNTVTWSEAYSRGATCHGTELSSVLSEDDIKGLREQAASAQLERRSCHGRFTLRKR